jgi:hypothetical protein
LQLGDPDAPATLHLDADHLDELLVLASFIRSPPPELKLVTGSKEL